MPDSIHDSKKFKREIHVISNLPSYNDKRSSPALEKDVYAKQEEASEQV
ncbi:hypothetical protein [Lucifera butyrica]|nr:hypothetical protein [Lucifera butyrica]